MLRACWDKPAQMFDKYIGLFTVDVRAVMGNENAVKCTIYCENGKHLPKSAFPYLDGVTNDWYKSGPHW